MDSDRTVTEETMAKDRARRVIVERLARRAIDNADKAAKEAGRPFANLDEVDDAAQTIADRLDALADKATELLKVARGE